MLVPCLSWLHLFTCVFAFFCTISSTLVSPCLSAHTGIIKTLSKVQCERERERENERQGERERGRFWDALWVTPLNEARYTAPLQQSTLQSLFCTCTVNIWERRGEERGWISLWAALGLYPLLLLSMFPFKLPTRATKLLMCLPHYHTFLLSPNSGFFYFANVPLSRHLLCLFFCFWL